MNREIKFRAWDNEIKDFRPEEELSGICLSALNATYWDLEQFTGLKDRNGKDIYEGDLLKFKILFSDDDYEVGQVAWSNQDAGFILECFNLWKFAPRAEIIGNIHENTEFLGEK